MHGARIDLHAGQVAVQPRAAAEAGQVDRNHAEAALHKVQRVRRELARIVVDAVRKHNVRMQLFALERLGARPHVIRHKRPLLLIHEPDSSSECAG